MSAVEVQTPTPNLQLAVAVEHAPLGRASAAWYPSATDLPAVQTCPSKTPGGTLWRDLAAEHSPQQGHLQQACWQACGSRRPARAQGGRIAASGPCPAAASAALGPESAAFDWLQQHPHLRGTVDSTACWTIIPILLSRLDVDQIQSLSTSDISIMAPCCKVKEDGRTPMVRPRQVGRCMQLPLPDVIRGAADLLQNQCVQHQCHLMQPFSWSCPCVDMYYRFYYKSVLLCTASAANPCAPLACPARFVLHLCDVAGRLTCKACQMGWHGYHDSIAMCACPSDSGCTAECKARKTLTPSTQPQHVLIVCPGETCTADAQPFCDIAQGLELRWVAVQADAAWVRVLWAAPMQLRGIIESAPG